MIHNICLRVPFPSKKGETTPLTRPAKPRSSSSGSNDRGQRSSGHLQGMAHSKHSTPARGRRGKTSPGRHIKSCQRERERDGMQKYKLLYKQILTLLGLNQDTSIIKRDLPNQERIIRSVRAILFILCALTPTRDYILSFLKDNVQSLPQPMIKLGQYS